MSRWAQLYWPLEMTLPKGTDTLEHEYWTRKRSFLKRYLSRTHQMRQELFALRDEWEKVFHQTSKLYDDLAPTWEGHALAHWLSAVYYESQLSVEEINELEIQPFITIADWDVIEGCGRFPEGPDWWATPEELERACLGLISLVEAGNETALKARNIYVQGGLRNDDPRLADEARRKEMEAGFVTELRRAAENAASCRDRGIEKVGYLIYL